MFDSVPKYTDQNYAIKLFTTKNTKDFHEEHEENQEKD
jgi:hypothetical protein